MENITPYIIKVVLISVILYAYYLVALRNRRFHLYNRFYLLASVLLSLILPFIRFDLLFAANKDTLPVFIKSDIVNDTVIIHISQDYWNTNTFLWLAYFLFAGTMIVLFLLSLLRIYRIRRRGKEIVLEECRIIESNTKGTPFSFFRLIFWNPRLDYRSGDGREILHHELIHVRQLHSLDKLIINLIQIVFWFNPVFWLIKREINIVHEFLADEKSIGDADGAKFSRLALQTAYPGYSWPANNNFAYSPLKRRLTMILKNNKKKVSYFGRLMVLPLTSLVFVFFSLKAQEPRVTSIPDTYAHAENGQMKDSLDWSQLKKQSTMDEKDPLVIVNGNIIDYSLLKNITGDQLTSIEVLKGSLELAAIYGNNLALNGVWKIELKKGYHVPDASTALLNNSKADTIPADPKKVFIKTEVPARFPGGDIGWSRYINKVMADHESELKGVDVKGGCKLRFVVDEEGKVSNVEALTKTGTKAARIAIDAIQKGPKWVPAQQNGRVVKSYVERTVHFVRFTPPKVVKDQAMATPTENTGRVMSKVEKEAQFPGGIPAWKAYIAKAFKNYLNEFRESDYGTCQIRFIVHTDGSISDIEVLTMKNTRLAEVAVNALRQGPKWIPAKVNGKPVNAYWVQPVTLVNPNAGKGGSAATTQVDNRIFLKVEKAPEFPGGAEAWDSFLRTVFQMHESELTRDDAGTCKVKFIVRKDGSVSDVKAITMEGTRLARILVDAIKEGPKWIPAEQNDRLVNAYLEIPVQRYAPPKVVKDSE